MEASAHWLSEALATIRHLPDVTSEGHPFDQQLFLKKWFYKYLNYISM